MARVLIRMRLIALLFTAMLVAGPATAQPPASSSASDPPSSRQSTSARADNTGQDSRTGGREPGIADREPGTADQQPPAQDETQATKDEDPSQNQLPNTSGQLPVSLDKIRGALEQPPHKPLLGSGQEPTFRVQIREQQKLEELLSTLDYNAGPTPAGGVYAYDVQRQQFPTVDNPLQQPYAAFNQPELLTILIENLVGHYLGGKAIDAVTSAERARAEAAARQDVRQAVAQYCAARPNGGAGIAICTTPIE